MEAAPLVRDLLINLIVKSRIMCLMFRLWLSFLFCIDFELQFNNFELFWRIMPLPPSLPRVVELGLRTHGISHGAKLVSSSMQRLRRRPPQARCHRHRRRPRRHLRRPAARLPVPCPSPPLCTPHPTGGPAAAPGPRENKSFLVCQ
jgi:hypothetical protein